MCFVRFLNVLYGTYVRFFNIVYGENVRLFNILHLQSPRQVYNIHIPGRGIRRRSLWINAGIAWKQGKRKDQRKNTRLF